LGFITRGDALKGFFDKHDPKKKPKSTLIDKEFYLL